MESKLDISYSLELSEEEIIELENLLDNARNNSITEDDFGFISKIEDELKYAFNFFDMVNKVADKDDK